MREKKTQKIPILQNYLSEMEKKIDKHKQTGEKEIVETTVGHTHTALCILCSHKFSHTESMCPRLRDKHIAKQLNYLFEGSNKYWDN